MHSPSDPGPPHESFLSSSSPGFHSQDDLCLAGNSSGSRDHGHADSQGQGQGQGRDQGEGEVRADALNLEAALFGEEEPSSNGNHDNGTTNNIMII